MIEWLLSQHVVLLAFLAGLFTWGCTILGSAVVFFFTQVNRRLLDATMGFAAGVMIAASFWSLLNPALEFAQADYGTMAWLPVAIGFLVGGFSLRLIDILVPHLHLGMDLSEAEGIQPKKKLSKTALLFLAITIHNFPEGLALGVTFGALASSQQPSVAALVAALSLTVGIGLQNIPEGAALSIPIRAEGRSRKWAFFVGAMSAIVEPVGAVLGAALVLMMVMDVALG